MPSKKRDDFGRFTAENPKTILMRVTKAEKSLIYRNRLREFFFKRDPYRFYSEEDVIDASRKVCSSLNEREIKALDVFEIYFDVLKDFIESNLDQTQILSCVFRPASYEIHLSYRLPWIRRHFPRNLSWKWDRTIRKISSSSLPDVIPIKTHRFGVDTTNQLHIMVDLALNFPKQLVNSFKELLNSDKPENYLFGITHKGTIFPINVNSILSGNYNLLLISQAFRPMNHQEIQDMIEKEEYGTFIRISKANLNELEKNPRYSDGEVLLEAILQEEELRYVDCFLFAHLDFENIQQLASDIIWHHEVDRIQSSSRDYFQRISRLEFNALDAFLVLNKLDIPIEKNNPPIKILVSGCGIPGVTSVTTVLVTGNTFLNELRHVTIIGYERKPMRIRETDIVVFDLGCQSAFLDRFTGELSEYIFSGVTTLIFVVDSLEIRDLSRVRHYLEKEIDCLKKYSPLATHFVFLNKIDLIPVKLKEEVIESIVTFLNKDRILLLPNQFFPTSCQNTTILKARDAVFENLIQRVFPDMSLTTFKRELIPLSHSLR